MHVNVHAIVLRSERSGEGDRRVVLFTREKGRVAATARGVSKPGSRLAAAVEPCVESRFRLWLGTDAVRGRITGGAVAASFPALRGSWNLMGAAQFLCEWTDRLTGWTHPHPEKYDLLRRALDAFGRVDERVVRLAFLCQFLDLAGYSAGEEVLGPLSRPPWDEVVDRLRSYDFESDFPAEDLAPRAEALEDRLLLFVAPLLDRPLRTHVHGRRLRSYLDGRSPGMVASVKKG
jgi:hypothetical protein